MINLIANPKITTVGIQKPLENKDNNFETNLKNLVSKIGPDAQVINLNLKNLSEDKIIESLDAYVNGSFVFEDDVRFSYGHKAIKNFKQTASYAVSDRKVIENIAGLFKKANFSEIVFVHAPGDDWERMALLGINKDKKAIGAYIYHGD